MSIYKKCDTNFRNLYIYPNSKLIQSIKKFRVVRANYHPNYLPFSIPLLVPITKY